MNRFFTLLLAATCLTATSQVPDYVPTDGLVAWFPCDSSLLDLTGTYTAEEVAFEGFLEGAYGETNGALGFDGESDFISFEGNPVFDNSFSIGLWIKTEFEEHGPIVHVGRDDGTEYNGFSLGIGEGGMNTPGDYLMAHFSGKGYFDVSSSVPYESWQHVCITWGSQVMTFYVQGESVGSYSTTSNFHNPSSKLYLAAFSETVYEKYGGALDQIGLWNRALSPAEVNQLFMWNPPAGCTEQSACNYDADAAVDDGSCHFLCQFCQDGTVWDEEIQGCISANTADINNDGCVQLNDLLDLLSAYGNCGAEESPWQCGDMLEYQGYDYETVQIGEQCWFAENLRAENYRNGDAIPASLSDAEWAGTAEGAVSVYGGDMANLSTYGRLYNWYAVDDDRSLCPIWWHVPTDGELVEFENYIISQGFNDSVGAPLKSIYGWSNGGNGTDNFGFSGLPGGFRSDADGYFFNATEEGYWWSSTGGWTRRLKASEASFFAYAHSFQDGFSIRCIKDTE